MYSAATPRPRSFDLTLTLTLTQTQTQTQTRTQTQTQTQIQTLTRWAADARQTASAVTMHAVFHRGFILWGPLSGVGTMFFYYYVWPPLIFLLIPALGLPMVATVSAVRKEFGLRLLGLHEPNLWFDKACVHQKRDCLTQCGLHLFEHYLDKSDRLMILFQPSCARAPPHPRVCVWS